MEITDTIHVTHGPVRTIKESVDVTKKVDEEDRIQYAANGTGFIGVSVLCDQLHDLYQFDILKNFVFDVMHTLSHSPTKDYKKTPELIYGERIYSFNC